MSEKSLFKKSENEQGYLKCGIMGFPGSGKTYTGSLIAIGLHKKIASKRPIFAIDTEKGFDYVTDKFKSENIQLEVARTRAFIDLLDAMDEVSKSGEILLIDSITHFWQDIQESFKKKMNRSSLRMQDWGQLKFQWNQYTTKFLNSNIHIIMCGRAGDDYESYENEEGKLEHHKSGTKMQAEKNIGFEPGLAIEMERVSLGPPKRGVRNFANRAFILKDRFDCIDGQFFDNPTFEAFVPHIDRLNIGNHAPIGSKDSTEMFSRDSDRNFFEMKKQIEIIKEEIEGALTSAFPGRAAHEVKAKTDLLFEALGTRSWIALDEMKPEQLRGGYERLKSKIAEIQQDQPAGRK